MEKSVNILLVGTKAEIEECLGLLSRIDKEFPEEADLEALHSVTGIYAELKKYREKINSFPPLVRELCEFIHAAGGPNPEVTKYLDFLRNRFDVFCTEKKESFLEKRQRVAGIAQSAGFDPSRLFHLLGLARLKGILDRKDSLIEDFIPFIRDYLQP